MSVVTQDPTVGSWTPINMWAMIRALINNGCPILTNSGAPTNGAVGTGTFAGQAGKGSFLIDYVNGVLYVNTGTLANVTWSTLFSGTGGVQYSPFANTATFNEFAQAGVTAGTTQTQAGATQLNGQMVSVTTVTNPGDGVKLPASQAGLEILVINKGANAMRVYGSGADTIDDQTNTVGVLQMANSAVIYSCAAAGNWYTEGLATGFGGPGLQTLSSSAAVSAFAGGGQGSATALTSMVNRVTTVATAGDSVKLPASAVGLCIIVINNGANDMQVFGAGTDTIDGVATATGVAQATGTTVTYTCEVAGNWISSITAASTYGLNRLTDGETLVADSNATVTAAQLLKGFLRSIPTAARTWTLDTAANLDAAIPGVKNGHNFTVYVNNNSAGANSISFTAGSGMTFFPTAGVTIAQNKTATLTFFRTGAAAWSVYHQVGA